MRLPFRYVYIQSACFNEAYSYREIKNVDKIYITYTLYENYENLTYDLTGMEENLDVVKEATLELQDYFVNNYKENNAPMSNLSKDGYIKIQYIHRGKETTLKEYTYDIVASDVQKIKKLFYKYEQTFDLKPL